MKILVVTNVYLRKALNQGQASFVRDQLEAIHKYHPDIEFTTYIIHGREHKLEYLKSIWEVRKLVNSGKFDAVHVHYGFAGLFLLFMPKPKIPVIVTLHGGDIQKECKRPVQIFFTKKILKKVDFVCSLNEKMKDIVKNYCKRTTIIPISIDMKYFHQTETPRPISKDVKIIFPATPNREVKNYPLFDQTVKLLESKYGYKVERIIFDNISHEEVRNHYLNSDLELLTSFAEGSPGVVKEAMACNLPIVATNAGDVAVLLKGVENCAVTSKYDAETMAEYCDKALRHDIPGITGRERLLQLGYDDKSISDKMHKLYSELIAEKANK